MSGIYLLRPQDVCRKTFTFYRCALFFDNLTLISQTTERRPAKSISEACSYENLYLPDKVHPVAYNNENKKIILYTVFQKK